MAGLFDKISSIFNKPSKRDSEIAYRNEIQNKANQLWEVFKEILLIYNQGGCQCQYPRYHQYVEIDCVDYRGNFYMSETEGLVANSEPYFNIEEVNEKPNDRKYTCKKCGSVYEYNWQDFSIHVDRSYLKIRDKKVGDIGAPPQKPIPFYVGMFGHKLAPREDFLLVDLETFRNYLLERKVKPQ